MAAPKPMNFQKISKVGGGVFFNPKIYLADFGNFTQVFCLFEHGNKRVISRYVFSTTHPVTWIQRKSHRFGQSAHVDWGKIEQDPAGLVLILKTWALYSVRCPGRRPSILMSHSHRHRNKKEGGWIYILSRSIRQWIVNNLFHAIKIKIACCLVSWVILCNNERYVMCSN